VFSLCRWVVLGRCGHCLYGLRGGHLPIGQ
jgi:hypothetical protein